MPRKPRITEQENPASAALDTKPLREILRIINREDQKVAPAIAKVIPQIERAAKMIVPALAAGGRLVYLGAGTSGRLGVLDAAECAPTFSTDQVVGVLAGAPRSMFHAGESAEDDPKLAVRDLKKSKLRKNDVLVGISASGRTPYTMEGLRYARRIGAKTVALTSNPGAPITRLADVAIVPITGPEVLTGSTRMKAGTAQKLVLNMLSTACMVRLGRVLSNWMIGVQLNNQKLRKRAEGILIKATGASAPEAARAIQDSGGKLPVALLMLMKGVSREQATRLLKREINLAGMIREAKAGAKDARKVTRHDRSAQVK